MDTDKEHSIFKEQISPTVKIGFLVRENRYPESVRGAEMAVELANKRGGLNGKKFELVIKSMEGPWGTGSKQAIDLIFEDKVWGLLGSLDGRNAHLVEQAATKSGVVFISAWTGDPTLSQAFVPWFFNCVPDYDQQAVALVNDIYTKKKYNRILIMTGNDYDSKMMNGSLLRSIKESGFQEPVSLNAGEYLADYGKMKERIAQVDPDCILILSDPLPAIKLIGQLRNSGKPLFGSLNVLDENVLTYDEIKEADNIFSVPAGEWKGNETRKFREQYLGKYGRLPGMAASYSYDGMCLLIDAIKLAGEQDREKIQNSLKSIVMKGITGTIRFDERGKRSGSLEVSEIKDGMPVIPY